MEVMGRSKKERRREKGKKKEGIKDIGIEAKSGEEKNENFV